MKVSCVKTLRIMTLRTIFSHIMRLHFSWLKSTGLHDYYTSKLTSPFTTSHFIMPSSLLVGTHPQYAVSLTNGPATQEINLIVVVEDDDDVLFAELIHCGLIGVQSAICARPPLQQHHQLC